MKKYRMTFELTVEIDAKDFDDALDIWDNTVDYKNNPVRFIDEQNIDNYEITNK